MKAAEIAPHVTRLVTPAEAGGLDKIPASLYGILAGMTFIGIRKIRQVAWCALFLLVPLSPAAQEARQWSMLPGQSSIVFEAVQNGAPVTGEFKTFTADIRFDPRRLESSRVTVTVDMASVSAAYEEVPATLRTPAWFDAARFPRAVFETRDIAALEGRQFEAAAMLTVRGRSLPVKLPFSLDEYSDNRAVITGVAVLSRTAFGIGQGEWENTDAVKDAVKVTVRVTAVPTPE